MAGRYGSDQLNNALLLLAIVLMVIEWVMKWNWMSMFILALFILCYFRMFSRNLQKRAHENEIYLQKTNKWRTSLHQARVRFKNRKQYKYFKCPQCGVRLRLTRGCGEKNIVCSQCKHTFHVKA